MKNVIRKHRTRKHHARSYLTRALKSSYQDIKKGLEDLGRAPSPLELAHLIKTLGHSSAWLSRSALRYLLSQVNFSLNIHDYAPTARDKIILDAVHTGEQLPSDEFSDNEIFETIFNDLEYAHHNHLYETTLNLPDTDITMALVSGVFNEIFSTPAFARGADHLQVRTGLKSVFLKASGAKGIEHNTKLIHKQLKAYLNKNPGTKLWLVAFSKGGVDCLHFMHKYKDFCDKHVIGLSALATPILGTRHLEKRVIKGVNLIERYAHTDVYKKINKKYDFLDLDFQKSLSYDFQANWFSEHKHDLPKCFYTAVGFESQWYQSHLWMIMTKLIFQSDESNDGVVDIDSAQFPKDFPAHNLGILKGHHLVGARSSFYSQEALLEAHLIYLDYRGLI